MSIHPSRREPGSDDFTSSVRGWIQQGEALFKAAKEEYRGIEAQLDALEAHLAAKGLEIEELAEVLGKPAELKKRRLAAELIIDPPAPACARSANRHTAHAFSAKLIRQAPEFAVRFARMAVGRGPKSHGFRFTNLRAACGFADR